MRKLFKLVSVAAVVLSPAGVFAHEGHAHDNPLSPGHYITNPEHSIQLLLIVVASIAFAWLVNRSVKKINQR